MHTKSRTKKQANMLGGAGRATFMLDGRYILAKAASLAIATDLMSESIPVHRTHARNHCASRRDMLAAVDAPRTAVLEKPPRALLKVSARLAAP